MWDNWTSRWKQTLEAIEKLGGANYGLKIGQPASERQIEVVESKLGYQLPESFRDVLLHFSGNVEFEWHLNDYFTLPHEFRQIFSGECFWNIKDLLEIEEERKSWVKECFPNEEDEYDLVWHNKLSFMSVANGDQIAIDLKQYPNYTPVIYLSHDGGEGHGYILGNDFQDFIDRWTLIGCPGMEDWQMLPFMESPTSGILPHSENSVKWRKLIGLEFKNE